MPRLRRPAPRPQAPVTYQLPIKEIVDGDVLGAKGMTSWYRLPPFRWSYMTTTEREAMLSMISRSVAALAGRKIHLRTTTQPYPVAAWARDLDQQAIRNGEQLRQPGNRAAWLEQLGRTQAMLSGSGLGTRHTYVGIEIADRRTVDKAVAAIRKGASDREIQRLGEARRAVDAIMARPGLDAVRADHIEVHWLAHQSVGLLVPGAPEDAVGGKLHFTDLPTFTDGLEFTPLGQCVKVTALPSRTGGQPVTRYVMVLSLGRMEDLYVPESHDPWLAMAAQLGFDVEVSAHLQVLSGADARRAITHKLDLIRDQERQYDAHDLDHDPEIEVVHDQALATRHAMDAGDPVDSVRVHGQYRLAVAGRSPDDVLDRARQLEAHYLEARIQVEYPKSPLALMREFVPGAEAASDAHTRRGDTTWFAAAVPHLDTAVGDRTGIPIGEHGSGPALWETHGAMEHGSETTGLTQVVGEPGSGKSTFLGRLAYFKVLENVQTTILDPSGPLARLVHLPELAGLGAHVDLLTAPDGALSPFAAIPVPVRDDSYEPGVWEGEAIRTVAERAALARDIVRMLLPPAVMNDPRTEFVIARAFERLGRTTPRTNMGDVLAAFEAIYRDDNEEHARHIAIYLRQMQEQPLARLLFAPEGGGGSVLDVDKTLLVITMAGLTLPKRDVPPEHWGEAERLALPLLHLAAYITAKRIYSQKMSTRKLVEIDEAHWITEWPSGLALWNRLARDSRKWHTRVVASSQIPRDVDQLSALSGESFMGLLTDEEAQLAATRLLRIPPEYAHEFGTLSPPMADGRARDYREFLMRDRFDRVERIAVSLDDTPNLAIALDPDQVMPWAPHVTSGATAGLGRALTAADHEWLAEHMVGQPGAPANGSVPA